MPTYEYACQKCGKNFDAYQSMRDEAYKICPKELCRQAKWGKGKVTRLLGTGAGLIFKGSGFYITDYRSNSYKEGAKNESASSGSEKSGGESSAGKTESKPAPATAPGRSRNRKQKGLRLVTKLVCPDCRHENEPERIYCHNCGARLDRSGAYKGEGRGRALMHGRKAI